MSRSGNVRKLSIFSFNRAIVRLPARSVVDGLRADDRGDPTYDGVKAEHDAYVAAIRAAGVMVTILPALEQFPDSIFVEDPALVFPEGAILLRPGAPSRAGEALEIAPTLHAMFDNVVALPSGGFADGGDVLVTARGVMIGLSARTDRAGAEALVSCLAALGHEAAIVIAPDGVLHFKSACSLLDEETIISTAALARSGAFSGFRQVIVADGEEGAANALRINEALIVGADFPRMIERLDTLGYKVVPVKTSEIGKLDAGLSCMSLRWHSHANDRSG